MNSFLRYTTRIASASALVALALMSHAETLQPGQLLTFVLSENKPGGEVVQKTYFDNAFPLAQAAGMRELSTFKVEQVYFGDGKPLGSGLYLWPNKTAAAQTRNNPKYLNDFKPLRRQVWNQLQSIDMEITSSLEINLDRTKPHTVALVWLKDKAAYDSYYQGTQALRDRMGVKTLLKLPGVRYDKLTEGEINPPDLVVLLQWNSRADIDSYAKALEFQANHEQFKQGIASMEWYRLGFWN